MRPGKRLTWLLALALVASLAISSVKSLTEPESSSDEGFFEEGYDNFSDYEGEEGDLESAKQEYAPPQPQVGTYNHMPSSYPPPPPPPPPQYAPQYEQQQQYAMPPPPPPPVAYPKPVESYVPPPPPMPVYSKPEYYPVPVPVPVPVYQKPVEQAYAQPAYQPAPVMNYTTTTVVEQAPVYQQQPQPAYQPVVKQEVVYQPVKQEVVYQQQPAYQPVKQEAVYQQQQPAYQPKQEVYQPKQEVAYQQPAYQQPQVAAYPQQQQANYSVQPVVVKQTSYVQQPIANYSQPQVVMQYRPPQYSASSLAQRYSLADLAPFTSPFNYRANHPSLHYYKALLGTYCPSKLYSNQPSYIDIEAAFAFAITQLGYMQQGMHGNQYMNASSLSFAARHQISSYLSQKSARMDEEGLLVEFVSKYLADRICMSKWDRQRYLPTLTKMVAVGNFPQSHACSQYHAGNKWNSWKNCYQSKYRSYDGFCNNPYHPYWGKSNVCHLRLLSPDYADGISAPRDSLNGRYGLPNPRIVANIISNDVPLEGPYNLMKMQWGQFINHDISFTALSSYDGLVDCCKHPHTRGCWPINIPYGDRFYSPYNITCLNFIRSGVCPTCQLGPRQQTNKNTAFLDASHVYGNTHEQSQQLRAFVGGMLKTSTGRNGEQLLPVSSVQEQCVGTCYQAGDSRANQHPALTALHVVMLRNHNRHAQALARRHPNWTDEIIFQEARRINIAEYQMITYNEYFPIVFGPVLSAYYQLTPLNYGGYTQYNPKVDPTTWNEYSTATCRFGHSQISSVFGLYSKIAGYGQPHELGQRTYRLKEWYFRPSFLADGLMPHILNGLMARPAYSVDPWVTNDVRNHLYQTPREHFGGDLVATNIWRGRDHGIPGYVHYLEYCFNYKVRGWKDLQMFIPPYTLNQLRKTYRVVENIDLFIGGLAERHFPGADIGPTFACVNGIQYHHLKFGDRYYFEHGNQAGSFTPVQLDEIRRASLARLMCRTGNLPAVPQYAFLQPSMYNPLVNCSQVGDIDYNKF